MRNKIAYLWYIPAKTDPATTLPIPDWIPAATVPAPTPSDPNPRAAKPPVMIKGPAIAAPATVATVLNEFLEIINVYKRRYFVFTLYLYCVYIFQ